MRDYKGASAPPGAGWAEGGALQVALYMLAARELLGLEPVGGSTRRCGRASRAPRGSVRDDVDGALRGDRRRRRPRVSRQALDEVRERALETARELRAGAVERARSAARPKGCAYPTVCRAGG